MQAIHHRQGAIQCQYYWLHWMISKHTAAYTIHAALAQLIRHGHERIGQCTAADQQVMLTTHVVVPTDSLLLAYLLPTLTLSA